jgi:hypothetical protein
MKTNKNAAKAVTTPEIKTSADRSTRAILTPPVLSATSKPETAAPSAKPAAPTTAAPATAPSPITTPAATTSAPAAPTKAAGPAAQAATTQGVTVIDVKHDVGFGNAIFVRGQGAGLTWEHGVPLTCVDGKTWRWSGKTKEPVTFKLLINDQIWSSGQDLTVKPGQKLEIRPTF